MIVGHLVVCHFFLHLVGTLVMSLYDCLSLYYSMTVGHLVVVPLLGRLLVVAHGHGHPGGVGAEQGHQPAHSRGVELQHHQHWTTRNSFKPQISCFILLMLRSMHKAIKRMIWVSVSQSRSGCWSWIVFLLESGVTFVVTFVEMPL